MALTFFSISTPSLGITDIELPRESRDQFVRFQLPLSGSQNVDELRRSGWRAERFQLPLSGSQNVDELRRSGWRAERFQLPLSGSQDMLDVLAERVHVDVEDFNSLSRDHFQLLNRVEEFTRFTFQLPLSGSR